MPELKPVSKTASVPEPSQGLEGLPRLVRDLKEDYALANLSPDELAAKYGLSSTLVKSLLSELNERGQVTSAIVATRRLLTGFLKGSLKKIKQTWINVTEKPYRFVFFVLLVMGMGQILAAWLLGSNLVGLSFITLFFVVASPFLMGCTLRWGKPLLAVMAAGMEFLFLVAIVFVFEMLRTPGPPQPQADHIKYLANGISLAFLISCAILIVGILVAFIGHIAREVRYNRSERRLGRQALLNRSFSLESQLAAMERTHFSETPLEQFAAALRTHAQYPLVILVIALALGTIEVAARSSVIDSTAQVPPQLVGLVFLVFFVLKALFILTAGYLAPSSRSALLSMVIAYVGSTLPIGLPRPGFGFNVLVSAIASPIYFITLGIVLVGGLAVGSVLEANRSEMKRRRVAANDPATVAAEIIRTHWRLYGKQRSICVMVVDVAGSTRMKSEADPSRVEYSFRAYQSLIVEITETRGGKVISTAGDGAVCSFSECHAAMEAARDLQTAMANFNAHTNRLPTPFRLRIGLHAGESEVDLTYAPFNRLIDISAHVEQAAPVGGIAVTEAVALQLSEDQFVELAAAVDETRVSVVINPTRDV